MENILDLIDKTLSENKIRYSCDDGFYTLYLGSLQVFIQTESADALQFWITDSDDSDNDLFHEYVNASNDTEISKIEIEQMVSDIKERYAEIMKYYNKIINLFEKIAELATEHDISQSIIGALYDKIMPGI